MNEKTLGYEQKVTTSKYYAKTFGFVFLALMISAITAYGTYFSGLMYYLIEPIIMFSLLIAELVVVVAISRGIYTKSSAYITTMFVVYSVLTGLTLSVIFGAYTGASIGIAFLFAAFLFLDLAFIGYSTKVDLQRWQPLLMVGLLTMVGIGILSFFMNLSNFEFGICLMGIVVFLGITAYDVQKMAHIYNHYQDDEVMLNKMCVYSALQLYLDFVNIFLYILRILGRSSKN